MQNFFILATFLAFYTAFGQKPVDSADYYFKKAMTFEYESLDSMLFYAEKLHELAEDKGDPVLKASFHAITGVGLQQIGNYDSAIYHQQEALRHGLAAGDSNQIALAYQHLGVVNKFLANYDIAIEHFLSALRISEKIGKDYISAMSNLAISQIHYSMGRWKEALEYAQNSIDIARDDNNHRALSGALIERGNNLTMFGELDQALADFTEAKALISQHNIPEGLASIYNNIGAIYFYKGDFRQAIVEYTRGKDEAERTSDPVNVGICLLNTGEAYIYLKEYENAEKYLFQSLEKFREMSNKKLIVNNYEYLHQMELTKGDFKSALKYYKLKDLYEDSILNENNLTKISDLKIAYETEKKEQQVKLLTAETQLQTIEIEQTRYLVGVLILLLVLSITGIVLLNSRRNYKLKAKMAEEKEQMQKTRFKAVIDAEEKERKRIARELHDGLGQILSTARITISALDDEEEHKQVQNSIKLIDHAVDEVRSISHNMMPNALVSVGLDAALEDMLRKINQTEKIAVSLDRRTGLELDEATSIAAYRVFQEVLNNALKYAEASEIEISIDRSISDYEITIRDNGKGFDVSSIGKSDGIGWSNIQSRVELLGGEVHIFSKPAEGTAIKFNIPLSEKMYQSVAS